MAFRNNVYDLNQNVEFKNRKRFDGPNSFLINFSKNFINKIEFLVSCM